MSTGDIYPTNSMKPKYEDFFLYIGEDKNVITLNDIYLVNNKICKNKIK